MTERMDQIFKNICIFQVYFQFDNSELYNILKWVTVHSVL